MNLNRQYSLNFAAHNRYAEEDFIVSPAHEVIYASIIDCTKRWGVEPYKSSLLLIGPKSSGKTHLAHIWSHRFGSKFLSAEDLESMDAPGYIIEDISSFEEETLLHIFNSINEAHKYLLLTAESSPSFALPDLRSRLNAVNTLHLDLPDEEMTKILLMHHFTVRSLKVQMEVVEYLAKRITRDYHFISIFVERLDHFALESKRAITIPLAAQFIQKYSVDDQILTYYSKD
jgi:chromosomal replication initiation ATPase DnaA